MQIREYWLRRNQVATSLASEHPSGFLFVQDLDGVGIATEVSVPDAARLMTGLGDMPKTHRPATAEEMARSKQAHANNEVVSAAQESRNRGQVHIKLSLG